MAENNWIVELYPSGPGKITEIPFKLEEDARRAFEGYVKDGEFEVVLRSPDGTIVDEREVAPTAEEMIADLPSLNQDKLNDLKIERDNLRKQYKQMLADRGLFTDDADSKELVMGDPEVQKILKRIDQINLRTQILYKMDRKAWQVEDLQGSGLYEVAIIVRTEEESEAVEQALEPKFATGDSKVYVEFPKIYVETWASSSAEAADKVREYLGNMLPDLKGSIKASPKQVKAAEALKVWDVVTIHGADVDPNEDYDENGDIGVITEIKEEGGKTRYAVDFTLGGTHEPYGKDAYLGGEYPAENLKYVRPSDEDERGGIDAYHEAEAERMIPQYEQWIARDTEDFNRAIEEAKKRGEDVSTWKLEEDPHIQGNTHYLNQARELVKRKKEKDDAKAAKLQTQYEGSKMPPLGDIIHQQDALKPGLTTLARMLVTAAGVIAPEKRDAIKSAVDAYFAKQDTKALNWEDIKNVMFLRDQLNATQQGLISTPEEMNTLLYAIMENLYGQATGHFNKAQSLKDLLNKKAKFYGGFVKDKPVVVDVFGTKIVSSPLEKKAIWWENQSPPDSKPDPVADAIYLNFCPDEIEDTGVEEALKQKVDEWLAPHKLEWVKPGDNLIQQSTEDFWTIKRSDGKTMTLAFIGFGDMQKALADFAKGEIVDENKQPTDPTTGI